jgi:hypothetical protein
MHRQQSMADFHFCGHSLPIGADLPRLQRRGVGGYLLSFEFVLLVYLTGIVFNRVAKSIGFFSSTIIV